MLSLIENLVKESDDDDDIQGPQDDMKDLDSHQAYLKNMLKDIKL